MNENLRKVTVVIPEDLLREIDNAVKSGIFASRSECIRAALREMFRASLQNRRKF